MFFIEQTACMYDERPSHIAWHKLEDSILQLYESELSNKLLDEYCCTSTDNRCDIDSRYNSLLTIKTVSEAVSPKTKFRPYWDKDLNAVMREKRRKWIIDGRPRGHNYISYSEYKHAKRRFRSHHRVCAENFLLGINSEIDNAAEVDSNFFWKKVNSRRKQMPRAK